MKTAAKSNASSGNPFGELNLRFSDKTNAPPSEDEPTRTLIVGNLGDRVGEEVLFELFLQAGPLSGIRMPREKSTQRPTGMAFVVFRHPVSVDFALRLMSGIRLYGRELVLTKMGTPVQSNQAPVQPNAQNQSPMTQLTRGHSDSGYHGNRDQFSYHQGPRPLLMAPPPPLFGLPKAPFAHHSPMPSFRPPYAPLSDPGYSHGGGDFRRTHVNHGGYTDRSRNGSSYQHQSYDRNETPKRPVPYSRSSDHHRGNNWR